MQHILTYVTGIYS